MLAKVRGIKRTASGSAAACAPGAFVERQKGLVAEHKALMCVEDRLRFHREFGDLISSERVAKMTCDDLKFALIALDLIQAKVDLQTRSLETLICIREGAIKGASWCPGYEDLFEAMLRKHGLD